ncbi:MAG: shikimate dehydrogenase [Caldilinea sp.]|nr:shikimate dehydrogenase [Caldilinea sp.]MDW8441869.1 shikimate dehydrogenase [Caldilineaceae bacterium]
MSQLAQPLISAKTMLVGLIGWPVSHSVSPAMHNAAFAALGMDWRYVPLPVNPALPGAVGDAVRGVRAMGMRGVNVTVPHKQAVLPFLDRIAPAAQAMRAVNTIVVEEDGSLTGDNTDAPGFIADLRGHGVDPAGLHALVLGAGGSARAVVYGLAQAGVQRITVANRSIERAHQLLADLRPYLDAIRCQAVTLPDGLAEVADAPLIVNCTPLGMTPHVDATPWPLELPLNPGQTVYDLVYNPPDTLLLQQARRHGARAIGGLGMLIWQGALAFERWTGRPAPVEVMRAAAEEQMRTRKGQPSTARTAKEIQVRLATPADADAISRLHAMLQSCHAEALPTFFKQPPTEAFSASMVKDLLAEPSNVFLVAVVDGKVVGYLYADVSPAQETSMTYRLERFWIHHIAVEPSHRRQGIGTALIDVAKAYARDQRIEILALSVWTFNQAAVRFFQAQGFEVYNYRMWLHLARAVP